MAFGVRSAGLVVAAVTFAGCADEPRGLLTVVDSAGVEIVTNRPGSLESAEAWSLSAEPVLEIGAGVNPDVPLVRVAAVAPLAGGRVAVGTNLPPRALIFEPDGTLATTLGREGEGPGEFLSVGSVVALSTDSVAVWDSDRRRLSVFTTDARYVREVDLSDIAPPSTRAAPSMEMASGITHVLPSTPGSLVLFGEGVVDPSPEPGAGRAELPAYRITTGGGELASYGTFPGMEWFHGGPAGALPRPFGARTHATTSSDDLVVGTAETTEFRVFGPSGALLRIVRWPGGDRSVGGSFLSRWTGMVDSAPPEIRQMAEAIPRPERFPAYEGLLSTEAGEILVGDYPGPLGIWPVRRADEGPEAFQPLLRMPARRWLVFDSDGALVATVGIPEGFEPYAVRDGRLWGVHTDELDVESIRAYELIER